MATVTRPEVTQIRPPGLVDLVRQGRIRMPRFQRPFRWEPRDVEQLFDSVLNGYPIGNLLMWERPSQREEVRIGHLRIQAEVDDRAWWVVDGQQRLTGLVGALTADEDTTDPRFRIYYDLVSGTFTSLPRSRHPQPQQLPVAVAVDNRELLRWQRKRPWLTESQFEQCDAVSTAIRQYEIPVYIVRGDDEQALKNIFDRMNTFGKRLTKAEVFNALHMVSEEHSPSDLESLGTASVSLGFGAISPELLMQCVMSSREGRTDRDFRSEFKSDADRYQAFVSAEHALVEAISFLREQARVPHIRLLPYSLFLPVLVRFVSLFGAPEGRAAELLRRWVWRGSTVAVAPQGNTVALRNFAAAVADNPVDSAVRLLDLLPEQRFAWQWEPDLHQTGLNRAQGKLNVLALLDLEPVLLEPFVNPEGEEVAAAGSRIRSSAVLGALLDSHTPILQPIISGQVAKQTGLGDTLANRLVHPPFAAGHARPLLLNEDPPSEDLSTHVLDPGLLMLLQNDEFEAVLLSRTARLEPTLEDRVQRRALWGFDHTRGPAAAFPVDESESEI